LPAGKRISLRVAQSRFILLNLMIRIFVTAWLSLLLVGMQQQLVVHEVDHLRAKVQRGHDANLGNSASAECVECALLAGGANAVPAANASSDRLAQSTSLITVAVAGGQPRARPAFYQSRGPPISL
jgi:hypothetical protein